MNQYSLSGSFVMNIHIPKSGKTITIPRRALEALHDPAFVELEYQDEQLVVIPADQGFTVHRNPFGVGLVDAYRFLQHHPELLDTRFKLTVDDPAQRLVGTLQTVSNVPPHPVPAESETAWFTLKEVERELRLSKQQVALMTRTNQLRRYTTAEVWHDAIPEEFKHVKYVIGKQTVANYKQWREEQ